VIDSEWIEASVGIAERLKLEVSGKRYAAVDVADGGADANALAVRLGPRVVFFAKRNDLRADEAGAWAYAVGLDHKVDELRYDAIGIGAGAGAALRGKTGIKEIVAWSGADKVVDGRHPWDGGDERSNADMFLNANAQAWWVLRQRFIETFKAANGDAHDAELVISLDPKLADLRQLKSELSQVLYSHNANGKISITKTPAGYRSPNLADAVKMLFAPTPAGIEIIGVF
jgi:phage terminase large subunit